MKQVTIYSTPACIYCNHAKEFFKRKGIKYTEYDVSQDPEKRQEMVERSGQMGVPVIFVEKEMIIGFNEARLEELLREE